MLTKVKSFSVIFIICLIILAGFWLFKNFSQPARSAEDDNASGWAWSATIGWISFNSSSSGGSIDYGVNLDSGNGKLSGYAWSENIGWISFNESDTGAPPIPGTDPCSDASCIAKATPSGQIGRANVPIYGWARALSYGGGWDGWIRFDHGRADEVYIDTNKEFHGWAWSGRDTNGEAGVIGWISFNCADSRPGAPTGICATSNYKVITDVNFPPTATNLEQTDPDWCASPPSYFFSWTYSDPDANTESRFDFQVDDKSNFNSPEIDKTYTNLSYPSPSQNSQPALVAVSVLPDYLTYDETTYYWRVKVWDSKGVDSGWVNGSSFTTQSHHWPAIDFSWAPRNPAANEEVQFTDKSTCYDDVITGSDCTLPNDSFSWDFDVEDKGGVVPPTSVLENPVASFSEASQWQIKLEITDSDGYMCPLIKTIRTTPPLPKWKEIKPW